MSASREKKSRQESLAGGYVDPRTKREKDEQAKDRRSNALYIAIAVIFVIVGIVVTVANSKVIERNADAVTIGNETYTAADVSYFYNTIYSSFVSKNSYYLSAYGLDTSKSLKEQDCPVTDGGTWYDYFRDQALESLKSYALLAQKAEAEGFDGSEEVEQSVQDTFADLDAAAASAGYHIAVYSLEMQGERLGDRWLLAATKEVSPAHLLSGALTPSELREVHEASTELSRLPIYIDDNPSVSMDYVRTSAKLLQSKGDCDCLFIDYLQLCDMKSDQHNRNREQEVAQASRKAKMIAKELHIPVILLSQLNRNVEGHPDGRPALSDLRESGAIEQDADLVLMLSRPSLSGRETDRRSGYPTEGLGVIDIANHRNGPTGEIYFRHDKSMTKLVDYEPDLEWMKKNTTR